MRLDDVGAVADIHVRGWQSAYRGIMPQDFLDALDPIKRAEGWKNGIEKQPHLIRLVSEVQGKVTGFAVGNENRTPELVPQAQAEVWAIYVDPLCWGHGAGSALLQEFRARSKQPLCIWVATENKVGHSFYKKNGGELQSATKNEEVGGVQIPHQVYWYSWP